jgi:hypothetical protein
MLDSDYPALFGIADTAARQAESRYVRLVEIDLVLLVLAALLGVAENFVAAGYSVLMTILSAIALAAALLLETATRLFRLERNWYESRSVAESAKTATWRYIMHVDPFAGPDADDRLLQVLAEAAETPTHFAHKLDAPLDAAHQIKPAMRRLRTLPFDRRKAAYLEERMLDQASWYARKSRRNQRSAVLWFWIGIAARVAALLFAIFTIFLPFKGVRFVEFFAAVAAVATAWGELGRHEELSKSYGNAAHELEELTGLVERAPDEAELVQRVVDAEGAMSREYTLWMVKRT